MFKIKATSRPADRAFDGRDLSILSETVDYTYFVISSDDGSVLDGDLAQYALNGAQSSFFDAIDDIEPYGPTDRQGSGIHEILASSSLHTVDVVIWPSGDHAEATRRAETVCSEITSSGGSVLLRSISAKRSMVRVELDSQCLNKLLLLDLIETIQKPPVPFLDFRDWRNATPSDLELAVEDSATVGVLDDSPSTQHPLLVGKVISVESVAPSDYGWTAQGSHGTEVVGRTLYPNLHNELRDASPLTGFGSVRVMRILEPDPKRSGNPPRFATFDFPHKIVENSIRELNRKYGVRVFNLSLGYSDPYNDAHLGALTEVIDELVRELSIIVVVPTGNVGITVDARTPSGHHVINDKPNYFSTPDHRLSEPGPAALAVTVGSVALSGAPAELPNRFGWRAVSTENELSAFSRTGPGIGTRVARHNKPDFVHHGGNLVLNDSGHAVQNDVGAGIVTPSHRSGDGRLFAAVNGTSFAVPAVARVAADIAHTYPDASANLVRALLSSGSALPKPASSLPTAQSRSALYGAGIPTTSRAIVSGRKRATMTFDGSMPTDTVQIHPLPMPEVFRRGSGGQRSITVNLAFDPPVRRQRREYLAASMKVDIYRQIPLPQLEEMLVKQDRDDPQDLVKDRRHLDLLPGSNSFLNSTLQSRTWTARNAFTNDDETFYLVVTHRAQTWARDTGYDSQTYALAVTLEDRALSTLSLHTLLSSHVRTPALLRVKR